MSDLTPSAPTAVALTGAVTPSPVRVTMADEVPDLEALFRFAREAELRVQTLRMTIEERVVNARGETTIAHEILLRHPGHARVTSRRGNDPVIGAYKVWLTDGETVTTYDPAGKLATQRPIRARVSGSDDQGLPAFARGYRPLTMLPPGSLADTFVHPHGLLRNVLVTGPLALVGTRTVAGREAIVVRSQHPRSAKVLVDRPDYAVEVGIGRDSGFVLLLTERVGDTVTRHAEVTALELDPVIFDAGFELRLPAHVRRVY